LKRHIANRPRNPSHFCTNLHQNFITNRSNSLPLQSFGADTLTRHSFFLNQEILDFLIPKSILFGTRQQKHTYLHLITDNIELVFILMELLSLQINNLLN